MTRMDKTENGIFEQEERLLQDGKRVILRNDPPPPLYDEYARLLAGYEKLLNIARKVFSISDRQEIKLIQREQQLLRLLDHAGQGFLTFGRSLLVESPYSAECARIFGRKPVNADIAELLGDGDREREARLRQQLLALFTAEPGARSGASADAPEQVSGAPGSEPADSPLAAGTSGLVEFPETLTIGGRTVRLQCKRLESATSEDETVMMIMTDVTDKVRSQARLEYLSYRDGLTSLYNRAYAEQQLRRFAERGLAAAPIGILMADLNGLKLTNDVFGHEQGDRLLQRAAVHMKSACRPGDVLARWGGDEFLLLMPQASAEDCQSLIAAWQERCSQESPDPISVSLAVGAAVWDGTGDIKDALASAEKKMYKEKLVASRTVRAGLARQLGSVLQARGLEDAGHVRRLRGMIGKFAERTGVSPGSLEMKILERLSELHDSGRIALPAALWNKKTPLTPDEWEMIQCHSEVGYRLALSLGEPLLADAILAVHERWDGGGYPYGLKGEEIPALSRMFAIVDAYDVMIHDRPYRRALSRSCALEEIRRHAGTQFDPQLAKMFLAHADSITGVSSYGA